MMNGVIIKNSLMALLSPLKYPEDRLSIASSKAASHHRPRLNDYIDCAANIVIEY